MAFQSVIVALVVLVCLASVLRGVWKQFSSKGAAGCGGCDSSGKCSRQKVSPCGELEAPAGKSVIRWHTGPPAGRR